MTKVGLFGYPDGGKSTVFQALTAQSVTPQFLGYDLKPNQAMVKIPDERLDFLAEHYKTNSKVNATLEMIDIPGFDPSSTEKKLKNAILEHYRKMDTLALVVGLYDPELATEAAKEVRGMVEELVLLDYVIFERAIQNLEKTTRVKPDKEMKAKLELCRRILAQLEEGVSVRSMELSPEELRTLSDLAPMSIKPVIVVLNIPDSGIGQAQENVVGMAAAIKVCEELELPYVAMSAALEAEMASMTDEEASEYMAEFGISERALPRFIRTAFSTLGLITFLTASEKECRSWRVREGSTAQETAGVIHSDLARGFIRAETIAFDVFRELGGEKAAKAAGKYRLEGKEYITQDGDVMNIRFSV
jgi:GTP-binding protein YchF